MIFTTGSWTNDLLWFCTKRTLSLQESARTAKYLSFDEDVFVSSVLWENMISGVGSGDTDMEEDEDDQGDNDGLDGQGKVLILPSQDFWGCEGCVVGQCSAMSVWQNHESYCHVLVGRGDCMGNVVYVAAIIRISISVVYAISFESAFDE